MIPYPNDLHTTQEDIFILPKCYELKVPSQLITLFQLFDSPNYKGHLNPLDLPNKCRGAKETGSDSVDRICQALTSYRTFHFRYMGQCVRQSSVCLCVNDPSWENWLVVFDTRCPHTV